MFDLVVFDMDGVLVDSEPLANRILHKHLCTLGLPMTLPEFMRACIGLSTPSWRALLRELHNIEVPEEMLAAQRAELDEAYIAELKAVAGVEAAIQAVDKPRCVA